MIEINRWLYLGEDYSVDLERVEALIKILRRVGEVLEDWRRSVGGLWRSFSRCLELPGGLFEHRGASWRPLGASPVPLGQLWGALGRLLAAS